MVTASLLARQPQDSLTLSTRLPDATHFPGEGIGPPPPFSKKNRPKLLSAAAAGVEQSPSLFPTASIARRNGESFASRVHLTLRDFAAAPGRRDGSVTIR